MNAVFKRKALFISLCAFAAINMVPNMGGILFSMLILLVCGLFLWKCDEKFISGNLKIPFLLTGLILNTWSAHTFYTNWSPSSKLQSLAGKIGLSSSTFLIFCAAAGVLCATPFVANAIQWLFSEKTVPFVNRIDRLLSTKKMFCLLVSLSALAIALQIVFSFSRAIWYDESFSLALIKHSYAEMIQLTAADVHPPLYYIILKFCVDEGRLLWSEIPAVYLAKLVSIIPYTILFILGITKVRKEWGNYVSGMWTIALVAMPSLISYGTEIRMYSWAMLFVTVGLLCAHDIIAHQKKSSWILFAACGLASAYTHYFACIAAGIIYVSLLIWSVVRDKKLLCPWVAASAATVIGYSPWLKVFLQQAQTVSGDYWIADLTSSTIASYMTFACGNPILLLMIIILAAALIKNAIRSNFTQWNDVLPLTGIAVPIGTTIVGIVASLIIRPVFVARYMVPGLACLWLGVLIGNRRHRWLNFKVLLSLAVVVMCVTNIRSFATSQAQARFVADIVSEFFSAHRDAVYLFNESSHDMGTLEVMSESPCYLWKMEQGQLHLQVYNSPGSLYSYSEIQELLNRGKTVIFVKDSEEYSVEDLLDGSDLTYNDLGSYRVESEVEFYQIVSTEVE